MVKQVVVQECHSRYIQSLENHKRLNVGLIIGKISNNKDYVVRLVACPAQSDGRDTKAVEETDPLWVAGHAAQVVPCLSGGLDIIGVFIVAPPEKAKDVEIKAKQMLYQSFRLVSKTSAEVKEHFNLHTLVPEAETLFWTVVHINPKQGTAISCRQFDVRDNKDVGRPAEWKQLDVPLQLDSITSSVFINLTITVANDCGLKGVNVIKSALRPLMTKIAKAHAAIENKQRGKGDILNPSSLGNAGKKSKKGKQGIKPASVTCKDYFCQLFLPISECDVNVAMKNGFNNWHENVLSMNGAITGMAFVPPGTTVNEAVHSLKQDLVQSIYQRCQILLEDFEDGNITPVGETVLPRRVLCHDASEKQGERVMFSDYLLPDEPLDDCIERIKDNLDIELESGALSLEGSVEKFPPEKRSLEVEKHETVVVEADKSSNKNLIIALVSAAVAALGWMFSQIGIFDS